MEWLLCHNEEDLANIQQETPLSSTPATEIKNDESSTPNEETEASSSDAAAAAAACAQEAKSIKCEDCGKLFRSQLEVEFHATKSGHSNFSE